MKVNVLVKEKDSLEIELQDCDQALAHMIVERLNASSDVEFAAFKKEHPLVAHPKIYLRTKSKDPNEILVKAIENIRKEVAEFKKSFADAAG